MDHPMKRRIRRTLLVLLGVLAVAATCLGLTLGTEKGRQGLLNAIAWMTAGPDFKLEMTGLRLGQAWSVERVTVSDASGPWLHAQDLRAQPVLRDVLGGRLTLLQAGVSRLEITRLPDSSEPEGQPESTGSPALPPLRVQALDIDHLRLGPEVLGHEARLSLHGSLAVDQGDPRATLRVARLDRTQDALELDAHLRPAENTLDLRLDLYEAPQGLLHAALGVEGPRGISLTAVGSGPLEAWDLTVQSALSDVMTLAGNATLSLNESPSATLHVLATPGPAWSLFTGLPEGQISIQARGQWPESVLRLSRLSLQSPLGRLEGNATWDLAADILESEAKAEDLDLAWLMPEEVNIGPIRASATLRRDAAGLRSQAKVLLRDALVSGYLAPETEATLALDLPAGEATWRAWTELETHIPGLPEGLRSWTGNATLSRDREAVIVDALRLDSEGLGLAANATLGSLVKVDARLDLRRLSLDPALGPLSAAIDATLTGRLDTATSSLNATLEAAATRTRGLPAVVTDLFGHEARVLTGVFISPQAIAFRDAQLRSRTTANADAEFDLLKSAFAGRLDATLPQIRRGDLHVAQGAKVQVSGSGGLASFDLDLSGAAGKISWQDMSLDAITASAAAKGLPDRPAATVRVGAMAGQEPVSLSLQVEPIQNRLHFAQVLVQIPDASLRLSGDLDPETALFTGEANFQSPDLGGLGRVLGMDLAGELSLHAGLDSVQGRQRASLKGQGKSLRAQDVKAKAATINGRLADPGLAGGTDVTIELSSVGFADMLADQVSARLRDTQTGLGFAVDLAHGPSRTRLATSGILSADPARLLVEDLKGTLLHQKVSLESPLELTASATSSAWRETSLRFGPATLRSKGNVSPERADISADLTDFDPAVLRPLLPGLPSADLGALLRVQGSPSEPDAHLRLEAKTIRLDAPDMGQLPDLEATADLRLQGGVLKAETSLASNSGIQLNGRLSSPVAINLLAPRFLPDTSLSGQLAGRAKLLLLPRLLQLDDQSMDGDCDLDFRLAGTWENPEFMGSAQVQGARYENFRSGTILERVNVDAKADGQVLTLKMNATDGGKGTAEAVGQVDLLTFRHIFDVFLNAFQLIRQDLAQSTAKGGLRLQGNLDGGELLGTMTLDPTTIRLPSKLPADLARIEVQEINTKAPPQIRRQTASDYLLALDLNVAIPARMTVEGRGLESEWSGNLRVGGNHVQPVISGEMNLVRGKFDFLDRVFELTQGSVLLGGENPPSPFLEVLGETQILDNLIQVRISGPARDFRLSLTSVPALPQDELLAMILFGRSLRQISPLQAVRLAQAAAEMTGLGGATPDFLDSIKSSLGLQEVDVTRDDQDNTAVGIGGYVGGKYYVRTQSSVSGQDRTRVEIQITPKISVETEVGSDSRQGGGVMWKHDY